MFYTKILQKNNYELNFKIISLVNNNNSLYGNFFKIIKTHFTFIK